MARINIERMIDDAATASQNISLEEPVTREAIWVNILDPLLEKLDDAEKALAGLVGLVEMVRSRDDIPKEVKDVLATNHRMLEAIKCVEPAQIRAYPVSTQPKSDHSLTP